MKRTVLALALGSLLVGCQQGNSVSFEDLNPRQRDAVEVAERLVRDLDMSYETLTRMLENDNFTHEEALFAVNYIEVDWFEECADHAKKAIEYSSQQETHSYTREELEAMLNVCGFTEEQIEYGLKAVGY